MRNLKYAILGLLGREALTGYDIMKRFEEGLGDFWSARHSQIYPELKKLADEGLVEFRTEISGERLEKKLYRITDRGREDFAAWLRRDEPLEPTPKDVFRLKLYLLDSLGQGEALALVASQREKRERKLAALRESMARRYGGADPGQLDRPALGDYLVLQGAISREEAYLDWLAQCRQLLG